MTHPNPVHVAALGPLRVLAHPDGTLTWTEPPTYDHRAEDQTDEPTAADEDREALDAVTYARAFQSTPARDCPGQFMHWSAFGASYSDTICATACTWPEGAYPGPVLCDLDDECRPRDIPCPFCAPEGFDSASDEEGAAARVRAIETGRAAEATR